MTRSGPNLPEHVFVDTSAFYAASDRDNRESAPARALLIQLIERRSRLITTNFVIAEKHALLLARGNRHLALSVVKRLRSSPTLSIERLTEADEERAWEIVERYDDKSFPFVDASSFAVMERFGVSVAFTLNRHFAQYGWTVIREL